VDDRCLGVCVCVCNCRRVDSAAGFALCIRGVSICACVCVFA